MSDNMMYIWVPESDVGADEPRHWCHRHSECAARVAIGKPADWNLGWPLTLEEYGRSFGGAIVLRHVPPPGDNLNRILRELHAELSLLPGGIVFGDDYRGMVEAAQREKRRAESAALAARPGLSDEEREALTWVRTELVPEAGLGLGARRRLARTARATIDRLLAPVDRSGKALLAAWEATPGEPMPVPLCGAYDLRALAANAAPSSPAAGGVLTVADALRDERVGNAPGYERIATRLWQHGEQVDAVIYWKNGDLLVGTPSGHHVLNGATLAHILDAPCSITPAGGGE